MDVRSGLSDGVTVLCFAGITAKTGNMVIVTMGLLTFDGRCRSILDVWTGIAYACVVVEVTNTRSAWVRVAQGHILHTALSEFGRQQQHGIWGFEYQNHSQSLPQLHMHYPPTSFFFPFKLRRASCQLYQGRFLSSYPEDIHGQFQVSNYIFRQPRQGQSRLYKWYAIFPSFAPNRNIYFHDEKSRISKSHKNEICFSCREMRPGPPRRHTKLLVSSTLKQIRSYDGSFFPS